MGFIIMLSIFIFATAYLLTPVLSWLKRLFVKQLARVNKLQKEAYKFAGSKAWIAYAFSLIAPIAGMVAACWTTLIIMEGGAGFNSEDQLLMTAVAKSLMLAGPLAILSAPVLVAVQTKATIVTWTEYRAAMKSEV